MCERAKESLSTTHNENFSLIYADDMHVVRCGCDCQYHVDSATCIIPTIVIFAHIFLLSI